MHSQPGDAHPAWGSTTGDDSKIETVEASYDVANHEVAQRLGIGRGIGLSTESGGTTRAATSCCCTISGSQAR
ncbi:hypothetical protein Ae717Ps2_7248c [Pseudonocardia sp. Ae717_Ps2]|nr:hypothetical protein Ae717Ps2_7248c [Pseudonocardia sp. Ae717_Ps2]